MPWLGEELMPLTEAFPTKLSYSTSLLEPLFAHVCVTRMKVFLAQFSKFYTRYYRSSTGKESQAFLLAHIREVRLCGYFCRCVRARS